MKGVSVEYPMYFGAKPDIFKLARELRKLETVAEKLLVIELDGSIHDIPEYQAHDIGRSEVLNDFGIIVIRFTNEQILNEIDSTIKQIEITAKKLLSEIK